MNTNVDLTNVILKTPRLVLRMFKKKDLHDFNEYASVDGVGQMAGWLPHKSITESKEILDRFITGKKTFAVCYQNKVIGSLGIEKYNEEKHPEFNSLSGRSLGFVLAKPYWGLGLMPEAVKAVIDYCFKTLKMDFLLCAHFDYNKQSARVQEKCGFHYYKTGIRDDGVKLIINIIKKEDYWK